MRSIAFSGISAVLLTAVLAAASPAASEVEPDVAEILRQAEQVRSPDLDYAVDFTLRTVNPDSAWKERSARYTMIAHGKDHSLVLMREPKQFYPGTLLIMRNLYWMLFPRSEKPIQLSARHVIHGDISNGDLARGNLLSNYDARLEGEEKIKGDRCWRLELVRSNYAANYTRIVYWISKKKLRPVKFEYYGKTGTLLRSAWYENYRKGPMGVRSMRIEVETHIRPGERTTMIFSNLRPLDASGLEFTVPGLVRFRDAAREKFEADGAQAQPEELLAMLEPAAP